MRNLIFMIVLFFFLTLISISQTLYHTTQEKNMTFDIYNFTENKLVWNYSLGQEMSKNNFSGMDYGDIQSKRITNLIHKFNDWIGYSIIEMSKWVIEFGYIYHEYDYFLNIIKYWIFAMIIIALIPGLVPIIVLF